MSLRDLFRIDCRSRPPSWRSSLTLTRLVGGRKARSAGRRRESCRAAAGARAGCPGPLPRSALPRSPPRRVADRATRCGTARFGSVLQCGKQPAQIRLQRIGAGCQSAHEVRDGPMRGGRAGRQLRCRGALHRAGHTRSAAQIRLQRIGAGCQSAHEVRDGPMRGGRAGRQLRCRARCTARAIRAQHEFQRGVGVAGVAQVRQAGAQPRAAPCRSRAGPSRAAAWGYAGEWMMWRERRMMPDPEPARRLALPVPFEIVPGSRDHPGRQRAIQAYPHAPQHARCGARIRRTGHAGTSRSRGRFPFDRAPGKFFNSGTQLSSLTNSPGWRAPAMAGSPWALSIRTRRACWDGAEKALRAMPMSTEVGLAARSAGAAWRACRPVGRASNDYSGIRGGACQLVLRYG